MTTTQPTAVVVGASLAGMMSALALRSVGFEVTLFDRSATKHRDGAALPVDAGLLERLTGSTHSKGDAVPAGSQAWADVHAALRAAIERAGSISLRTGVRVLEVGQDDEHAWLSTDGMGTLRADMVVGADGHHSVVRTHVCPEAPLARYAGYLIWLGIIDESEVNAPEPPNDLAILYEGDYCLNAYYLPGADGSTKRGHRRIGWGWYDAGRSALLQSSGTVRDGVVRRSLRASDVPDDVFASLLAQAGYLWPSPWREAIQACVRERRIIATPIGEYLPTRLADRRICLVGDAAHLSSPMTGSGFTASATDAIALRDAFSKGVPITTALHHYDATRLHAARELVRSGQKFSHSFVADRTA